jgi:exodeoxyribonuclease (lambda-induced)
MMTAEQKAAWLAERCGHLTASNMGKALDFRKDGKPGADRIRLLYELVAERVTGFSVPHVVTDAMQHGLEYEDEAADKFVELTGRDLAVSHFYHHPTIGYFGATPDRELEDGLVEIKCPATATFIEWKLAGVVPARHKPQMLAQLACTGRKWCGFVAYDPRMREERQRLFLARFEPSAEDIAAVEDAARTFLGELEAMFEKFTTG